ncbi:MAG TPA: oxidoreductase [Patescibacteria group bacterium]|nr:oxidoreductase [Patescibacteria group bacterium]
MSLIDGFLNSITMYRLLLYYLIFLVAVGVVLSALGFLSFSPLALILTSLYFVIFSYITNKIFAYAFDAPTNIESVYISALILTLIVAPIRNIHDLPVISWMAIWMVASKFILAINKKHIFNPAAFGVAIVSFVGLGSANWWVGTVSMLPFVLLGVFIIRKIKRFDLVFYFLAMAFVTIVLLSLTRGSDPIQIIWRTIADSPLLFFAFIMLSEPLTTPPTKSLQSIYGAIVGILFAPQLSIGSFYTTPEIALLIGNAFSFLVSPKHKLVLALKEKIAVGQDLVDFVFPKPTNFSFRAGQYMEWTLPHNGTDSRGNRRYLTIASSPTEDTLRLGVKFHEGGSSFKKAMIQLAGKNPIVGAQLMGDFTLPSDKNKKLVFIAGGIGITPFRAMVKYLIDTKEVRDIVLFYSNKNENEIVYRDVFDQGVKIGLKTVYLLTDEKNISSSWRGKRGRLDTQTIAEEVPDYQDRTFYLSGPKSMLDAFEATLSQMGVKKNRIITDFFPGYA